MINQFASRQFIVFIFTGGLAAIVNFGSRIVYNLWVDFSVAIILAYITGMITAFILARQFVFKSSTTKLHQSAFFFTVVNFLAIAQTWLVSMFMAHYPLVWLNIHTLKYEIAHGTGVAIPVFTSYLGHKYWSFRE